VTEHVKPLDLGVTWDPNAPSAVLVSDDSGRTALGLNRHPNDKDVRCVVLLWSGTRLAMLSDPNDEAVSGHRLYQKGLSEVLWACVVRDSESLAGLEKQNRVHPLHDASHFSRLTHHVVLLKECVAEVVADTIEVHRIGGTPLDAATVAMRG